MEASVLLVDDTPDNLEMMTRTLRRLPGIHLVQANSGKEALAACANHNFAVVLLDVQMPVLNGIETAALIRKQHPERHIPIIFVTAHSANNASIQEAYALGAVDFLTKPINFTILRAKVSFFVEFFRNNELVRQQSEALLQQERQARKLLAERQTLEAHGEALARLVKDLQHANEALDGFASIVSHDLQEPLRGIVSLSQLLASRDQTKRDPQEQELLDTVVSEGERLQQMIRDLLTLARVGSTDLEDISVSLEESLHTAMANLHQSIEESQADISYDSLPSVLCHPAQAVQLWQNLIGNAIKFRKDDSPIVAITVATTNDHWHFQVKDNGIGIPNRSHDKIFAPFRRLHSRSRYPGTGIGLAICQKIVERRDGQIWVDSAPGEGTTFHFTLPKQRTSS